MMVIEAKYTTKDDIDRHVSINIPVELSDDIIALLTKYGNKDGEW